MRINKRQISLNDVKASFQQSGYVDWHINPRLSDSQSNEPEGDVAVQTADLS
jgi:ATP-dependent Clp protease adaptor protein ClpS